MPIDATIGVDEAKAPRSSDADNFPADVREKVIAIASSCGRCREGERHPGEVTRGKKRDGTVLARTRGHLERTQFRQPEHAASRTAASADRSGRQGEEPQLVKLGAGRIIATAPARS